MLIKNREWIEEETNSLNKAIEDILEIEN